VAFEALCRLTAALVRDPTPGRVAQVAIEEAAVTLRASLVALWAVAPEGDALDLLAHRGMGEATAAELARLPLRADAAVTRAARRGRAVVLEDLQRLGDRMPAVRARAEREGVGSLLAQPMAVGGRLVGVLAYVPAARGRPHRFGRRERQLVRAFAGVCGAALENAALVARLRESEERFRVLSEATTEGIVVHQDSRHLLVNAAFARMVGYAPEEAVGRTSFDFVAPESHDLLREQMRAASSEPYEVVGLRKDGSRFRAEVLGRTVEVGGRRLRVVAVRDVGERRRMEEALRASEERYRGLFAGVPVGLYRTRPDGRIVDANQALADLLGYADPAPLLARNAAEFFVDRGQRWEESAVLEREGIVRGFLLRLRRADGSIVWVEDTARVVRGADGQVVAYEGALVDVTEQRRATAGLRLLTEAGARLAASLDFDTLLRTVAELAVPALADWCTVYDVRTGVVRRAAVAYADPRKGRLADALAGYPPSPTSPRSVVARVIESGRSALSTEIAPGYVESIAQDEQHLAILRELGFVSSMTVPLAARGHALGAVALFSAESGRRFDREDLALAEELARRAALALDNARLLGEAQEQVDAHARLNAELRRMAEERARTRE
jgi:PAS domain S-box-containing protein